MRSGFISAFLGVCALIFSAMPAMAETRLRASGDGTGDRAIEHYCPAGQILVGFAGRSGLWLDAVQTVCAPLGADGFAGEGVPEGPVFGGSGGNPAPIGKCPAGTLMEDFNTTVTVAGKQVAGMTLLCRGANGRSDRSHTFGNPGYQSDDSKFGITDRPATSVYSQRCPDGQYPVGIHGAVGIHVNRLGVMCEAVARAAAPAAPRVIKSMGKPKPTAAPVTAFNGYWVVTSSLGSKYAIVLQAVGSPFGPVPMQASGQILDPDTKQGIGTLTGVIQPQSRQLTFNYGISNVGGGNGVLNLTTDGNSIVGQVAEGGKGSAVWNGTRGK